MVVGGGLVAGAGGLGGRAQATLVGAGAAAGVGAGLTQAGEGQHRMDERFREGQRGHVAAALELKHDGVGQAKEQFLLALLGDQTVVVAADDEHGLANGWQ